VAGAEVIHDHLATGEGLFLAGAHLGSFEVIRSLGKDKDLRVAMFMHENNAKKINAMLSAINPNASRDIISLGNVESMLQVNQKLEDGFAIGILADRIFGDDAVYPVQILDEEVHLPLGPFRLAALLKQKIMFMTGLYLGDNRYSIHFHPLADFTNLARGQREIAVQNALHEYASLIDYYCREAPYNWFNFFDFWQVPSKRND
jgi:predicted LPLAT superfamily acyltransferase